MGRKVSEGRSVQVTVPQDTVITQGQFVELEGVLGIAVRSVSTAHGETKPLMLVVETAEYETSQIDPADAFAKGDKVYWDSINQRFTTVQDDGSFCGIVTVPKDANNVIWFLFAPALWPANAPVDEVVHSYLKNRVETGVIGANGTAGQTHADGGAYDFNSNHSAGIVAVNGELGEIAAATNFDLAHGAESPVNAVNDTIIYSVVAKEAAGVIALQSVPGAAAPAAAAVAPTAEAITAAVGHARWIRLYDFVVTRTGAAAATGAAINTVRPRLA